MTHRLVCPLGHIWTGTTSSPCPECGAIGRVELALTALDMGTRIHGAPLTQGIDSVAETSGPVPTVAGCEVLGELARGGMGVVYRAHDTALGRDLALKVLRAEHAGHADLCQRFLEEAQVGGQLQHPGIVPVYHVGVATDGRPCFTMKLVQGRTLGELLRGRTAVTDEQARFLTIFEQVCQALAYAHDHGVLHRDLKPDNIMVGAFGEVLVMDWGLAKVLPWAQRGVRTVRTAAGSLASEPGSVLGTPAYMAPEQARGETELLDERADVFGLGGILCEILTGSPPYVGATSGEVALLAAQADLTPALARLDASGADADLIKLARECLAVDREARPRDAGLVVDRLITHRAALLERSTRAVVEKEMVRREQQHQPMTAPRRWAPSRLTLAVGLGLCLVLIALLAFGWRSEIQRQRAEAAKQQEDREQKDDARRRATDADLRQIADLRREGRVADARVTLARAEGRYQGDVEPASLIEARLVLTVDEHDRNLLKLLDSIAQQSQPLAPRPTAVDGLYRQAFGWYGPDIEGQDPASAARAVQANPAASRLVAALDDWARAAAPDRAERLRKVATLADTDPWQRQVRAADSSRDANELQRLAAKPEATTPTGALLLSDALDRAGETNAALTLLRTAQRRHPDDLCLAWTLAARLRLANFGRASPEVVHLLSLAVGLAPANSPLRRNLANALIDADKLDEALEAYQAAVRLQPTNVEARRGQAQTLVKLGRYAEALEVMNDPALQSAIDQEMRDRVVHLSHLEEQLPAYRSGKLEIKVAETAADLGEICQSKGQFAAAVRFYLDAENLDASIEPRVRLSFLRAAIRAGCGQGVDAPRLEAERKKLCGWASDALLHEAYLCVELRDSGILGSKELAASRARALVDDPILAMVRVPEVMTSFSDKDCLRLDSAWHMLGALLQENVKPQ